ncbi:uncharacterized protein GJ701_007190 [Geothlypis trichas]
MRDPKPGPQKGGPGPEGGGNTPKTNRRPGGGPGPRSQVRQPRPRPRGKVSIPTAWHPAASTVAKWVATGFLPPKSSLAGNGGTEALPRMVISGVGMFAPHSKRAMVAPGCALCLCNATSSPLSGWGAEAGFLEPTVASQLELARGGRDTSLQGATPEKPPPNPAKMLILNTGSRAADRVSCKAAPPPRKERPAAGTAAADGPGRSEFEQTANSRAAGAAGEAGGGSRGGREHAAVGSLGSGAAAAAALLQLRRLATQPRPRTGPPAASSALAGGRPWEGPDGEAPAVRVGAAPPAREAGVAAVLSVQAGEEFPGSQAGPAGVLSAEAGAAPAGRAVGPRAPVPPAALAGAGPTGLAGAAPSPLHPPERRKGGEETSLPAHAQTTQRKELSGVRPEFGPPAWVQGGSGVAVHLPPKGLLPRKSEETELDRSN